MPGELTVMRPYVDPITGKLDPDAGDLKIIWDADKDDEVEMARKQFNEAKKKGYAAFSVNKKGDKGEVIREFDPQAEKIIMAPAVAGG